MDIRVSKTTAVVLFATGVFFWGANWPVTKIIVASVPPIWSGVIRLLLAAAAMFILQAFMRQLVIPTRRDIPVVVYVGLGSMAVFIVCMCIGLQFLPAGRSAVISYTTAIWVPPAARILFGEPLPWGRVAGALLSLAGIAVLFNPSAMDWSDANVRLGNLLLFVAPIFWSASILYVSRHKWDSSPFQLTSWQMLLGGLAIIPFALIFEGVPHFPVTWTLAALFGYSSLLSSCYSFWAMAVVTSVLPASVTSIGVVGTPVVGIITSTLFLGEPIDLPLAVATLLVVAGILAGALSRPKAVAL